MAEESRENAESEARTETVSINVTPTVKQALERLVNERRSEDSRWSINREGWERLKYTFELTGTGGQRIDSHAAELAVNAGRLRATQRLRQAIFEKVEKAPEFALTITRRPFENGRPRFRDGTTGAIGAPQMDSFHSDYIVVDDLLALRADNAAAIEKLTLQTDSPVSDVQVQSISKLEHGARTHLLELLADLADRTIALNLDTLSNIQTRRALTRLFDEWGAIRECLIVSVLANYAYDWQMIRDDALKELIPLLDASNFESVLDKLAGTAAADLDYSYEQSLEILRKDHDQLSLIQKALEEKGAGILTFRFPLGPDGPSKLPEVSGIFEALAKPKD